MKTGVELIAAERRRQVEEEGWSAAHDTTHDDGEMAEAAACYALPGHARRLFMPDEDGAPEAWPWQASWWKPTPDDRVRELVKAGALIAAEIDRLQQGERAATAEHNKLLRDPGAFPPIAEERRVFGHDTAPTGHAQEEREMSERSASWIPPEDPWRAEALRLRAELEALGARARQAASAVYAPPPAEAGSTVRELVEALDELVGIVRGAVEDGHTRSLDSFTLQPAERALALALARAARRVPVEVDSPPRA